MKNKRLKLITVFCLQQIIPNVYTYIANNVIKKKIEAVNGNLKDFKEDNNNIDFIIDKLKEEYKSDFERKKIIEDKAKSIFFVISLSATILFASLNFLKGLDLLKEYYLIILLVLGIIYFVFSGINCLGVVIVGKYYYWSETEKLKEVNNSLKYTTTSKSEDILTIYKINKLNRLILINKNNLAYAAFIGLRNGIILIAIFIIILLIKIN